MAFREMQSAEDWRNGRSRCLTNGMYDTFRFPDLKRVPSRCYPVQPTGIPLPIHHNSRPSVTRLPKVLVHQRRSNSYTGVMGLNSVPINRSVSPHRFTTPQISLCKIPVCTVWPFADDGIPVVKGIPIRQGRQAQNPTVPFGTRSAAVYRVVVNGHVWLGDEFEPEMDTMGLGCNGKVATCLM